MTNAVSLAQGASNNVTMRNRIINGSMVIDQRNAGASVSISAAGNGYAVDRFRCDAPNGQGITAQQVSTNLAGFSKVLRYTAGTASTAATDQSEIFYAIEGYNVADMGFGAAGAVTFTLSFWATSSLSGTFGLVLENAGNNRQYITTYSLPVANTWTYITKTIVGDTSGTWDNTNGRGLVLRFDMGTGTSYSAAATNAWGTSSIYGVTGAVKLTQNTGATFTITGVQLEAGTTATPFENRLYGTELALCQRYYYKITGAANTMVCSIAGNGTAVAGGLVVFPVTMRAAPTFSQSGLTIYAYTGGTISNFSSVYTATYSPYNARINWNGSGFTAGAVVGEVVTGASSTNYADFSAEL